MAAHKKIGKITKLTSEMESITRGYPDLRIKEEGDKHIILGCLPITSNGVLLERYVIRLIASPNYPNELPKLFEVGGKLPKIGNRHFDPETEEACTLLKDEWGWLKDKYPTLLEFIKGPVSDFFIWQACYDHFGFDKLGDWPHGAVGRLAFYKSRFQTDDLETVRRGLWHLSSQRFEPNSLCYCGSGRKACHCHQAQILQLRMKIPRSIAKSAFAEIIVLAQTEQSSPHLPAR